MLIIGAVQSIDFSISTFTFGIPHQSGSIYLINNVSPSETLTSIGPGVDEVVVVKLPTKLYEPGGFSVNVIIL